MNSVNVAVREKAEKILSLLPGVDCAGLGGCGKDSCLACAEAIAAGGSVALCPACSQEKVDAIAEVMGVQTVTVKDEVAYVFCAGFSAGKARASQYKSCKESVEAGFSRGNVRMAA